MRRGRRSRAQPEDPAIARGAISYLIDRWTEDAWHT